MSQHFSYGSAATVSDQIEQEIQRFESVHPCIYAVYDLIEKVSDVKIAQLIRDNIIRIEDSFVNSQEWTCSRAVPELKLGLVGSLSSGKSSLVHRYLTGTYIDEDSPEGGRFKKEVTVDGQPYLLLIRDEGGPPEQQFTHWVDAVIFVFSLGNEVSFNAVYHYYAKMAHYRNTADIPLLLVGTQDAVDEDHPRAIDDNRARKLANDLKRCSYHETCAIYGHNVEKVFREACCKIINHRLIQEQPRSSPAIGLSCPNTPVALTINSGKMMADDSQLAPQSCPASTVPVGWTTPSVSASSRKSSMIGGCTPQVRRQTVSSSTKNQEFKFPSFGPSVGASRECNLHLDSTDTCLITTPSSTPNAQRKNRRISNIFNRKDDERPKNNGELPTPGIGEGRAIPIKQGLIYKRSSKALNKEWKKKYVCLYNNGRLTYYPNLKDYMDNIHGKEVMLVSTTVKVPGKMPQQASRLMMQSVTANGSCSAPDADRIMPMEGSTETRASTSADAVNVDIALDEISRPEAAVLKKKEKISKHIRKPSSTKYNDFDEAEGYDFMIVSLDNRVWHFEALSLEERDGWVQAIERQILSCLQSNESDKRNVKNKGGRDLIVILKAAPGNAFCADCGYPNPDWASLNLGALVCIQCSGIHRNLGTHISKVRSLDLDEWPPEHVRVIQALGNEIVNNVWEYDTHGKEKPKPCSSREAKEQWIRYKYENKKFLAAIPCGNVPLCQLLMEAICKQDLATVYLLLAHCDLRTVNSTLSSRDRRTPLQLACGIGNPIIVQLLLWFNADPKAVDQEGRSALWYAYKSKSAECIEIMLQNGCPPIVQHMDHDQILESSCVEPCGDCGKSCTGFENLPASII